MSAPLFEGLAELRRNGPTLQVDLPPDVVIPPGYEMRCAIDAAAMTATYRVEPAAGLRARWLRWRYPYRP